MTSSDPNVRRTVVMLERTAKKQDAPVWTAASKMLGRPGATKVEVNIGRLSRVSKSGQAVFVPGKVLGTGVVDKKLVVGAYSFSATAKVKIQAQGGSTLTVEEFVKKFPEGSGVKLVG